MSTKRTVSTGFNLNSSKRSVSSKSWRRMQFRPFRQTPSGARRPQSTRRASTQTATPPRPPRQCARHRPIWKGSGRSNRGRQRSTCTRRISSRCIRFSSWSCSNNNFSSRRLSTSSNKSSNNSHSRQSAPSQPDSSPNNQSNLATRKPANTCPQEKRSKSSKTSKTTMRQTRAKRTSRSKVPTTKCSLSASPPNTARSMEF